MNMTKGLLQTIKRTTTWGGALVTFSGIVMSIATGGSWWSGGVSLFGLLVTCCGHLVTGALDRHRVAERAADEERFAEMESMSDYLNKAGVFDNPEDLRRMIRSEASRYADEHQDDGR